MNADGSNQINISNNAAADSGPTWSPDSGWIAFTRGDDIVLMHTNGSNQTSLTNGPGRNWQPAWKP